MKLFNITEYSNDTMEYAELYCNSTTNKIDVKECSQYSFYLGKIFYEFDEIINLIVMHNSYSKKDSIEISFSNSESSKFFKYVASVNSMLSFYIKLDASSIIKLKINDEFNFFIFIGNYEKYINNLMHDIELSILPCSEKVRRLYGLQQINSDIEICSNENRENHKQHQEALEKLWSLNLKKSCFLVHHPIQTP